ncbi:hypothetical protein [Rheinheimera sp. EpRS3]|uniref:hypothetical protein n=1 Tax=Rheinheimera sp. EpRS3 TaxID=1712383 RepID=UPI000746AA67|nr:hypothetical protein [Rheinheimera sp. EpRS3]KUM51614.1 hypothetical protein AR688_08115 [Rheinheimera sp. EpRS3]
MNTRQTLLLESKSLIAKCAKFYDAHNFTLRASKLSMEVMAFKDSLTECNEIQATAIGLSENYLSLTKRLNNCSVEALFASVLFVDLISSVEVYLANIIRIILKRYPKKILNAQFSLTDVLDRSVDELVSEASEKYIYSLMYKKPKEIIKELCNLLSVDWSVLQDSWNIFIEAKARRDIGMHNNWVCNETYIRKVKESGANVTCTVGDNLIPSEQQYYREVVANVIDFVSVLSAMLSDKYDD